MTLESVFIFDIHNPGLEFLIKRADETCITKVLTDPMTGGRVDVVESSRYDKASQINHIHWKYTAEDGSVVKELDLPMRVFFPAEMDSYLNYNGLKVVHKYGWFDRSNFTSNSRKQIYVCTIGG